MNRPETALTLLLDEGAPRQAAAPFLALGHAVLHHQDVLWAGARDDDVVGMAIHCKAILVATDRDMQAFTRRFGGPTQSERYTGLDLIFLECRPGYYAPRLHQAMDFIELEWAFRRAKPTRRLWINVHDNRLTTYR